ncbi:MAG: DUF2513 domain-containing protein [Clostridiales bacterium]|nr:DUF2513 domain-containing protein [Clostridiales bacterium]
MTYDVKCMKDVLTNLDFLIGFTNENSLKLHTHTVKDICINLDNYSIKDVKYSLLKLAEAGFIELHDPNNDINTAEVIRMTYEGHCFLINE